MLTINKSAKAIVGLRTKKPADTRGPKAGSAMGNQSVTLTPAAPAKVSDVITEAKQSTTGANTVCVSAPGLATIYIPQHCMTGPLNKLAVVGGSYMALHTAWALAKANPPRAKLAQGVDAQNSPHTAKAIADAKVKASSKAKFPDPVSAALAAKAAANAKATPAAAKATPAAAKATPAAKLAATPAPDRKYKATKKPLIAKPGSFRVYMVETIRAHASTTPAKAAHAASGQYGHERLNFKWAHDAGYITLADLA